MSYSRHRYTWRRLLPISPPCLKNMNVVVWIIGNGTPRSRSQLIGANWPTILVNQPLVIPSCEAGRPYRHPRRVLSTEYNLMFLAVTHEFYGTEDSAALTRSGMVAMSH